MEYRDHENFQLAFSITKWQDMKKKKNKIYKIVPNIALQNSYKKASLEKKI